jgi:hypothetical protein
MSPRPAGAIGGPKPCRHRLILKHHHADIISLRTIYLMALAKTVLMRHFSYCRIGKTGE